MSVNGQIDRLPGPGGLRDGLRNAKIGQAVACGDQWQRVAADDRAIGTPALAAMASAAGDGSMTADSMQVGLFCATAMRAWPI